MLALPPPQIEETILVTASLETIQANESSDSSTVLDNEVLGRLNEPRVVELLRLLPSVSVAEAGPPGSQAQIRIRGAEANHTLLFVDGIKANDPASGNEARFEFLGGALADRIELNRGPQSALWGADAIGGVFALASAESTSGFQLVSSGEVGTAGFHRADVRLAAGNEKGSLVTSLGTQRSAGIDSLDAGGDLDGYRNFSVRASARYEVFDQITVRMSGFGINARSAFDGYSPITYTRADTDEVSEGRIAAGRLAIETAGSTKFALATSYLCSTNVNFLDSREANRTSADRSVFSAGASKELKFGEAHLNLNAALDGESEHFRASDSIYGGLTEQNVDRRRTGLVGEARFMAGTVIADASVRHDNFSEFADETTFSAGLLWKLSSNWSFVANFGEGIAQPTFQDLYGFFPSSFVGNPDLRPEKSRGGDLGVRFERNEVSASVAYFRQSITDEIQPTFDPNTFFSSVENGSAKSTRDGVEVTAEWTPSNALNLQANYSYLDAEGALRRPTHRAAIAAHGQSGRMTYSATLSHVGARDDVNYDLVPAMLVRLRPYTLLSARLGYQVTPRVAFTLRASNLTNAKYQDVIGYATEGRAVFAGLLLAK